MEKTLRTRIFTLMHELAHLTQGVSAICDVGKYNSREIFCNRVASEVLVPKNTLNPEDIFFKNGNLNLSSASHIYGVSKQTMVYRLYSSRLIGNELKEQLILEIEEKNAYDKLKKAQKNRNSSPRISTLIKKKKYDGEPYARLVLQAYENNVITAPKAVKYLDASIDAIENDMYN